LIPIPVSLTLKLIHSLPAEISDSDSFFLYSICRFASKSQTSDSTPSYPES
jgi:hypothetical protein